MLVENNLTIIRVIFYRIKVNVKQEKYNIYGYVGSVLEVSGKCLFVSDIISLITIDMHEVHRCNLVSIGICYMFKLTIIIQNRIS